MHFSGENMIYLINSFNPHWEGHALPEWSWPKRRIFEYHLTVWGHRLGAHFLLEKAVLKR